MINPVTNSQNPDILELLYIRKQKLILDQYEAFTTLYTTPKYIFSQAFQLIHASPSLHRNTGYSRNLSSDRLQTICHIVTYINISCTCSVACVPYIQISRITLLGCSMCGCI